MANVEQKLDTNYSELLEDGKLLLYSRNGVFQARVYKGKRQYIHRSLKTRKLDDARKAAIKFYYEIEFKREQELPLQTKSFGQVLDEYITLRQRDYERSLAYKNNASYKQQTSIYMLRQIIRVSKFWQEYCGKTSVVNVDNAVLSDYIAWRRDYYHKIPQQLRPKKYSLNPADKTLEWETTFAKTVIKFAHERGYRGKAALPTWRYKAERKIVRPSFTLQEYKLLYTTMRKWIAQTKNKNWRYTRELLRDYVLLLANSGMRVGEANNLRESDIVEFVDELGRKNYMFMVKGKTGKRVVIPRASAVRYVERTLERNAKWQSIWDSDVNKAKRKENSVRTQGYAEIHLKADWFFRMNDGRQLITLIDQFKAILKLCALEKNRYGEEYTLYSLRHFYAVQMLRRGKVSVFDVARNMGTSVQIIEQYYGKDATPLVLATALGG